MSTTNTIKIVRPTDLDLTALAGQIKHEHGQCENAARSAVQHAIRAGELLVDAKARCQHGTWKRWIEEHCGFSLRTAQLYMGIARDVPKLPAAKAQRVALLPSLRGIERHLRQDRQRDEQQLRRDRYREEANRGQTAIVDMSDADSGEPNPLPEPEWDPAVSAVHFLAQVIQVWEHEYDGDQGDLARAMITVGRALLDDGSVVPA